MHIQSKQDQQEYQNIFKAFKKIVMGNIFSLLRTWYSKECSFLQQLQWEKRVKRGNLRSLPVDDVRESAFRSLQIEFSLNDQGIWKVRTWKEYL